MQLSVSAVYSDVGGDLKDSSPQALAKNVRFALLRRYVGFEFWDEGKNGIRVTVQSSPPADPDDVECLQLPGSGSVCTPSFSHF